MFEDAVDVLDAQAALDAAAGLRRSADAAEAALLEVAAHYADLHPALDGGCAGHVVPGMERLTPLAGDGTPEVAEFAPAELGAALGITTAAACSLVGEALELRHRLPRVWARVRALEVPAWRARLVARQTVALGQEAADYVDRQVAHIAHALTSHRVARVVEAAVLRFDPDRAAQDAARAAEYRGVRVARGHDHGVVHIGIDCDATDAESFDAALDAVAASLGRLGDHDLYQVRRARAVGVLADPQQALDLLSGATRSLPSQGAIRLHVHVVAPAAPGAHDVARVEGLGAVSLDVVRRWLGRSDVTLAPTVHVGSTFSVDAHEIPDALREAEIAASPYCVFPWCNRESRGCDIDHSTAYVDPDTGGPPGQTTSANLGPLCRRHHRMKTHGRWRLEQPINGVYLWTSPHGRRYRVDPRGTTALDDVA